MKNSPKLIPREQSRAFGKDVYLLGRDTRGFKLWLEAPKWDCGWYWAFGYVETYSGRKRPENAADISSHTHVNSRIFLKPERYDFEKKAFLPGKYLHHWNEQPDLKESVFTEDESWAFSDRMKTFYTLKDAASLYHSGHSGLTSSGFSLANPKMLKYLNEVEIPKVTAAALDLVRVRAEVSK